MTMNVFSATELLLRAGIVLSRGLNLIKAKCQEIRPHDDFILKSQTVPREGGLHYGA
jgi:hypothetical protein